ncbi:MAG: hypothetical protein ACTHJL_13660 [Amnibacterium sp.]
MRSRPGAIEGAAGALLAAVVGALVGTLGTFKHQAGISAATGAGFPYGLLLALAMVAAVLLALRVSFATRLYAIAAGLGTVAAIGVFSLRGPGGSQVVIGNVEGVVWMIAPVLVAAAIALLPGRRPADVRPADGILEADAAEEDPA